MKNFDVSKSLLCELPEYVQPVDYIFIEKMPLTAIGKVDFRALEQMQEE